MTHDDYFRHLTELRKRIIRSILYILISFPVSYFFLFDKIYYLIVTPVKKYSGIKLVMIEPMEFLMFKLKTSLIAGVIIVLPFLMFEVLSFIVPGLKKHEKILIVFLLPLIAIFSIFGALYGYKLFFPFLMEMVMKLKSSDVEAMLSISKYTSFLILILIVAVVLFQIPFIMLMLNRIGRISKEIFKNIQKNIILFAFIIGAMLTPPDVISQVMFALPFIFFYEIGIILIYIFGKKEKSVLE